MKTLVISILFILALPTFANGWFPSTMQIYVTPTRAEGIIFNNTPYRFLKCKGQLFARTQMNQVGSVNVCAFIPRGGYVQAYLNSYGNAYLLNAWANVQCRPANHFESRHICR